MAKALSAALLVLVALMVLVAGGAGSACAQEGSRLGPVIPKAKGKRCVADTDFMRRSHMTLLTHDRDRTARQGVRPVKGSLKGCVDCHAVPGKAGKPVSYKDPKHFCRVCHDYVAVKLDCFECHRSTPEAKAARAGKWKRPHDPGIAYLRQGPGR